MNGENKIQEINILYRVFFLNDIFEILITPSFLEISLFCKKPMKARCGTFYNLL